MDNHLSPSIRDPKRSAILTKAVLNVSDKMGITQASLSHILGTSQTSITRMRNNAYDLAQHPKVWELGTLLVRLYQGSMPLWPEMKNHCLLGCITTVRISTKYQLSVSTRLLD